jgi:hypothetical protein
MSLDITLRNEDNDEVYSDNITHNLGAMAKEAGVYMYLWRPDEINITHAHQLIEPLMAACALMATEKARFSAFNAQNGWGAWEDLLMFCANYLQACKDNPDARVSVFR